MSSNTQNDQTASFLHEAQKLGQASGKIEIDNLDEAVNEINCILVKDAAKAVKTAKENDLPTARLSVYCHDCRTIVTPELKKVRGRHRKVCGTCKGVKISAGREEALKKFYHIDEE